MRVAFAVWAVCPLAAVVVRNVLFLPASGWTLCATSRARTESHHEEVSKMSDVEQQNFASPAETRTFPHGKAEILEMGRGTIGRLTLEPGWRWSNDLKPIAGTASCEVPHFQYHVSGQLAILMDDGRELLAGPGDVTSLPEGHDAWVVGDETVVTIDWNGAGENVNAAT
jgi:hypothetical protein